MTFFSAATATTLVTTASILPFSPRPALLTMPFSGPACFNQKPNRPRLILNAMHTMLAVCPAKIMPTSLFLYPGLHFLRMVSVFVSERQTRKGISSLESSSGCSGPSRHIGPVMGTRTGIEQHTVNVKVSQMQEMPCSCQICKILHGRIILGHPVHAHVSG